MPITLKNLTAPDTPVDLSRGVTVDRSPLEPSVCCGGAAPVGADACCALDADVKSSGGAGCGCNAPVPAPATSGGCC
jgi:hypothetical protein